jgi:hypothetical protein
MQRPGGGLVLILLSVVLLLVGGGLGPPLLGMILGVAGVANDTLVYALTFISFAALILSLVAARAADQIAFDHGHR